MGIVSRPAPSVDEEDEKVPVPLVYAFLEDKSERAYTKVFRAIKEGAERFGIRNITPEKLMIDFELAEKKAGVAVYPSTSVHYCFFHLGQNVYRRVQSEGLQEQYNNPLDRSIKQATHMLLSLAFVPSDDVVLAYEKLYGDLPDDFLPVATYFEETYITGRRARGRRHNVPPRYPIKYWNCYDATLQNAHRTNNISEGWHNRFQLVVGKHHPSVYAAVLEIIKEQADTETLLAQLNLGQSVKAAPKKKWKDLQTRIRRIVGTYGDYKENDDILDYLRTLGHHFLL